MLHLRARLFKRLRRNPYAIVVATIPARVERKNPPESLPRRGKAIVASIQKLAG
jgi:hypothetical protein